MLSRKEMESLLGTKFTDAEWKEVIKSLEEAQDKEDYRYLEKHEA